MSNNNPTQTSDLVDLLNGAGGNSAKKTHGAKTERGAKRPARAKSPAATQQDDFQPLQKTSFDLKRGTHEKLKEIARRNGLSLRELITAVLYSFIEKYEKTHGPITPRESNISLDELV